MKALKVIEVSNGYEYEFILQRKTGKNKSLAKGNQILNSNDRMHYIVKSQITEFLRTLACQKVGVFKHHVYDTKNTCTVLVTVYPPTKRRIDPSNLAPTVKALMDGMTDANLWVDDSEDIVALVAYQFGKISNLKEYKIVLTITDYITDEKGE